MEINKWLLHNFFSSTCQTETVEEPIEEDAEAAEESEKETPEEEADVDVEEEEEDKDKPKTKKVGCLYTAGVGGMNNIYTAMTTLHIFY